MGKKVAISGYYGYGNFGDEIILSVLVDHLCRLNSDITVFSHNPELTSAQFGISSVKNFDILSVMKTISSSDIIISGGGSLLQDVTSLKSLLYYSFIIWYAQFCGKKVIIFAQGIGPLTKKLSNNLVTGLLSKCDLVSVRDVKSQEFLIKHKINAELVSDPMFSVDLPVGEKSGKVGVQLRAFKAVDEKFLKNLANQVILNFGERKIEIYSLQETVDYTVCKNFEKMLKDIYPQVQTEVIHKLSNNDMIVRISELEYFIAMRFHALLAAIKTGVKPLAINYDAKVSKLAYEAFLPMISLSGTEDFEPAFDKLKQLNLNDLAAFANSNTFDWSLFDKLLK